MRSLAGVALALAAVAAGCGGDEEPRERAEPPPERPPANRENEDRPVRTRGEARVETVAGGLEAPWEIAFLPDGRALVTERPGRVRLLSRTGRLRRAPVAEVPVAAIGEGGLLGVAVDPDFRANRFVYLFRTTDAGNVVTRFELRGERLEADRDIVEGIEAAAIHDGGRLRFGPDDRLYIGTGDAGEDDLAQDRASLNGKILAMEPERYRGAGGRPEVHSLGHRNGQGFDWEPGSDRLVESEHGPIGNDEVNVIRAGANYGWPEVEGEDSREGFVSPVAVYSDSIAPSGATFVSLPGSEWTGDFLIAALVGEQIRRVRVEGSEVTIDEPLFEGDFGRLRTVV